MRLEKEIEGKILVLEEGKLARKSDGAVLVQYGETVVLVTAVVSSFTREEIDFIPLIVDYREKAYAVGKIPGGFFKREGKPSDEEILASRLIDRSVRPLFPKNFRNEVQIIATVLSASHSNQPVILSIIGASLVLSLAGLPFAKNIGGVRIGKKQDKFLFNPSDEELEESELNLVVAGTKEGLIMVEGGANKIGEEVILEALQRAHSYIKEIVKIEEEFLSSTEKKEQKIFLSESKIDKNLEKKVKDYISDKMKSIKSSWSKEEKDAYMDELEKEVKEKFLAEFPEGEFDLLSMINEEKKKKMRELIIQEKKRWDGRGLDEIRPISCEVGILSRVHGSGLFTRGETQALVVTTLGTSADEQIIDGLQKEEISKRFMFHYNFLPFSTGEIRRLTGPGRREIGHGFLAERALLPVLPNAETFPYTIRLVSDILESNGSSSMASVCGGSLCLMDAGVPISEPVAGVGMGLIKEGDKIIILTDIQGLEDHLGDMDFKIAGTREAVTALQLDIKISEIDTGILREAFRKAKIARNLIINEMEKVIKRPRSSISNYAPRIITSLVSLDKIGEIIGPGGRVIKKIIKETGVNIDIDDTEGRITISSTDEDKAKRALEMIKGIIKEPKVGEIYLGKVKRITNFGAFVEIMPGKEGLVHISELSNGFVKNVSDVVKVGEEIKVKVINIDESGRLNLSKRKAERY